MPKKTEINFTKKTIDDLPLPPKGKRSWYWDTKTNGLAVRVSDTGRKKFYIYRWAAGKPQQYSLGPYPDMTIEQARRRAAELNGAVAKGEDLKRASGSTRGEWTFCRLFEWYLEDCRLRGKKSGTDYEMYNRLHFQEIGRKRLSKISKANMRALHAEIESKIAAKRGSEKAGNYAANKALRVIRAVYNKAINQEIYDGPNPANGIEEFDESSRARRLMPSEIPAFMQAVEAEGNVDVRDFVLLSLFTGARKSNILQMRWEEIDIEARNWHIPVTKTGDPQDIPLHDLEIEILLRRKASQSGPWVFPGTGAKGHMMDPKKGWRRILNEAGIEGLRLHDLRRSLASWMVDTGASLPVIGKALNHRSQTTTAIYARLSMNPVREAKAKALAAIKAAGSSNGQLSN